MIIQRRNLLLLSSLGALTVKLSPSSFAKSNAETFDWKPVCKRWFNILMPADDRGPGADSNEVWKYLVALMQQEEFKQGILFGFEMLDQLDEPKNDEALTALLLEDAPISKFLNAFFEIIVEAYYGSKEGWLDLGLKNPPQPLGFTI